VERTFTTYHALFLELTRQERGKKRGDVSVMRDL